jgi:hypothetical protein
MRAQIFAARGLLEFIPRETVTVGEMRHKLGHLLENGAQYERRLAEFPMTAFEVINSRVGKIALRSPSAVCNGHEALWMPDFYGYATTQ